MFQGRHLKDDPYLLLYMMGQFIGHLAQYLNRVYGKNHGYIYLMAILPWFPVDFPLNQSSARHKVRLSRASQI